ncbi:MAG: hypothetical protein H0V00_13565 [Chloroflexia bacterium]|nr:hypothetical protein [Chloroflexia bacterium]
MSRLVHHFLLFRLDWPGNCAADDDCDRGNMAANFLVFPIPRKFGKFGKFDPDRGA